MPAATLDPHSAPGISALGAPAAKAAMTELGPRAPSFFGELARSWRCPSRCMRPWHRQADAAISFHPTYMLPLVNTARWDTHCGAGYACIYSFECPEPESWLSDPNSPIPASHVAARAPGATDALFHMFGLTKQTQSNMLPFTQGWSLSEAILTAGQATADNLPAQIAEIQYLWRTPTIEMAEQVARVDNNARPRRVAHCTWKKTWSPSRGPACPIKAGGGDLRNTCWPARPNGVRRNSLAREIQQELGLTPMDKPHLGAARPPSRRWRRR
jgi:aminobenzoyl-glutamate utilization protein B